jgi:CheY-like chemotaxis protein
LEGHSVLAVEGGVDGLRILSDTQQQLVVVLDNLMPDMTGMDLLDLLVRLDQTATTRHRFILVTASTHRLNAKATAFLRRHHIPVLEKPFSINTLYDLVARAATEQDGKG